MLPDFLKLKDIKPALSGYVADSLLLLKKEPFPDDDAIHNIRVLMKKARATVKLLASQMDKESFEREYKAFKEAGRILSSWRDTSVHRKTIKSLKKVNRKLVLKVSENPAIRDLLNKTEPINEIPPEFASKVSEIGDLLKKSAFRLRFYTLCNLDPKMLLKELESTYNIVSTTFLECRNNPKPVKLHELRKKTKDFLYQLYFFRPLNPSGIKNLEKRLDSLAQNLGKYNDLTQLMIAIGYDYSDPSNTPELNEFVLVIKGIQDRYLEKVWPSAHKIFSPGKQLSNVLGLRLIMI